MLILTTIIEQGLIHTPLILGAHLALSLLNCPDLSLASAFTVGAILAAKSLPFCKHLPPAFSAIAALIAAATGGALVGLSSSCLTRYAKLPHLLSAIIMEGLFQGIIRLLLKNSNTTMGNSFDFLKTSLLKNWPHLPAFFLIATVTTIIMYFFLKKAPGTSFVLYRKNQRVLGDSHSSLSRIFILGIMIGNALAGITGYCVAQSHGFVDCSIGNGIFLLALLSLLLGRAFYLSQPFYNALIGLFIYFSLHQIALQMNINIDYFVPVHFCILLIVLLIALSRRNIFEKEKGQAL